MMHLTDLPPEILSLIGDKLDAHGTFDTMPTIRNLLCVSHFCHRSFRHLLWRRVTIRGKTSLSGLSVLKAYAHLVLYLHFEQRAKNEFFQLDFPHLVFFRCDLEKLHYFQSLGRTTTTNPMYKHEDLLATLSDFISRHATIQDLVITTQNVFLTQQLWDTISTTLQTPRRLVINGLTLDMEAGPETKGPGFWRACTQFQDITYSGSDQLDYLDLEDYDFSGLKRLSYTTQTENTPKLWMWMCRCPNLTRFHWGGNILLQQVAAVAELPDWPFLEEFSLGGDVHGSDEDLARILSCLYPLKHLRLTSGDFGQVCFSILRERHFDSLKTLAAQGGGLLSSQMALEVLQGCAHLEEFRANKINLRDLRSSPQPWVCLGLKHLQVTFASDPRDPDADSIMFDQLSRLTRLEVLDMKSYGSISTGLPSFAKASPAWRVENGLLQLSTLTQLRVFRIQKYARGRIMEWRVDDFEWMLDHWPKLEVLCGNFAWRSAITEERVEDRIMSLIKQRGVRTY
ncbi:hypothetical protein BGZ95_010679 [Linnemannia exigua]|uniref:F-box domain-containing protein n=1 Tax=Linnemannia exigua TaxID=604196 RepID=A0AAD4H666_9FUNG|nr:hypothetical protein BGZ95_010679 [Linnemannia exigua]